MVVRRRLRIGIDLDNTLVSYEHLFLALAQEQGLVPPDVTLSRIQVRNRLRAENREDLWTELQGEAYGPRMKDAVPFDGAAEFLARCKDAGATVFIVSHRTRHPYRGGKHDLHEAAIQWLEARGFVGRNGSGLPHANVLFKRTPGDKLTAIRALDCNHFVDDLPELLGDDRFPTSTTPILFDPMGAWPTSRITRAVSWNEVAALILGKEA